MAIQNFSPLQLNSTLSVGVDDTGHDVIFYGATSGRYLWWDESEDALKLRDNTTLKIGSGSDLQIKHDGSNSYISQQAGGNLYIQQNVNDADLVLQCDDGSGGTTPYLTLDGSEGYTKANRGINILDDQSLFVGNGLDLRIYHNQYNSFISNNGTGDLYIMQTTNDKDIIFQSDDGSGGVKTYFRLDGSALVTNFPDNSKLTIGDGNDLQIYHDASNSFIQDTGTGDLYVDAASNFFVRNYTNGEVWIKGTDGGVSLRYQDNQKIITTNTGIDVTGEVKADSLDIDGVAQIDGALTVGVDDTGHDVKFFGATSGKYLLWDESADALQIPDSTYLYFGTGIDLAVYHNGTNSYLQNATGNLEIIQNADDGDIIFSSDDGSGGVTTYLTLDGGEGRLVHSVWSRYIDGARILIGTGGDLALYHSGSDSYITSATGNLYIDSGANDADIIFKGTDGGADITALTLDMSDAGTAIFNHDIKIADDGIVKIGDSADLYLSHDATNSHIANATGDLKITQNANDKDIIFNCDDGSGGNTAYLTLDGSNTRTVADQHLQMADGKALYVGNSSDAGFYHSSGQNYIENNTGNLTLVQNTDDGDIIFQSDDGAGGVATYLTIDGSDVVTLFSKPSRHVDNVKAMFGNSNDLSVFHDATDSRIQNAVGDLYITNTADDKDVILRSDDGSGGVTAYLTLDGGAGHTIAQKKIQFLDNVRTEHGDGSDLITYHSGTHSYIANQTGDLYIKNDANDQDIIFQSDDGSGGITEYFRLDGSSTQTIFSKNQQHADNVTTYYGNAGDLSIYHDGSNSYIKHVSGASGDLIIEQSVDDADIIFKSDDGSGGATEYFRLDGGSTLTYFSKHIQLADGQNAYFGGGGDGSIIHTGSNMSILNSTGNLTIANYADDKDILFQSDDGSGGVETYFYLDGSLSGGNPRTIFPDNSRLGFGNSGDTYIEHDGSNGYIGNSTGHLYVRQNTDDGDIIFQSDDNSGGIATYLTLNGGEGQTVADVDINFRDNVKASFGNLASGDLRISHDTTDSLINNYTGDLYIRNNADDKDIIFQSDDGSGGVAEYFRLDGGVTEIIVSKKMQFGDDVKAVFGAGEDLDIFHDGTNSTINNAVGNLILSNDADDGDIIFKSDDGSGGLSTYLTIDGSAGTIVASKPFQSSNVLQATPDKIGNITIQRESGNGAGNFDVDALGSYILSKTDGQFGVGTKPSGSHNGTGFISLQTHTGNYFTQLALSTNTNDLFIRSANNASTFSSYERLVKEDDVILATDIIKVLPHHFMSNEDGGVNKSSQFRDDTIIGVRSTSNDAELYAFVEIPYGKTARTVTVYGNDTSLVVNVYESDINAGALTDKTPGAGCVVGTECDITDVAYSATNYLVIKVTTVSYTNDIVYGAVVTIG